jgi:hypothetical protein
VTRTGRTVKENDLPRDEGETAKEQERKKARNKIT